jgi:hypothetical protein
MYPGQAGTLRVSLAGGESTCRQEAGHARQHAHRHKRVVWQKELEYLGCWIFYEMK